MKSPEKHQPDAVRLGDKPGFDDWVQEIGVVLDARTEVVEAVAQKPAERDRSTLLRRARRRFRLMFS